jgi:hypothetical protein
LRYKAVIEADAKAHRASGGQKNRRTSMTGSADLGADCG